MTTRSHARRSTRLAQAGAIALAAAATALLVLPVSKALSPSMPEIKPPEPTIVVPVSAPPIDISSASAVLEQLNKREAHETHAATPDSAAPVAEAATPDAAQPEAPPPSTEWTYLGAVMSPSHKYALVRMGSAGEQALIPEGSSRDGFKLDEVQATHILLTDSGGLQKRIDLLPPTHKGWPEFGPGRIPEGAQRVTAAASPGASGASPGGGAFRPLNQPRGPANAALAGTGPAIASGAAATIVAGATGQHAGNAGMISLDISTVKGFEGREPQVYYIDPVELDALVTKVGSDDFDEEWVYSTLKAFGLPPDATFEQRMGFFQKVGISYDTNPDFIKRADEVLNRLNEKSGESEASEKERESTSGNDNASPEEQAERREREAMIKEQQNKKHGVKP